MPRKKMPPKVRLHPDYAAGREVALARATELFVTTNGNGRRVAFERVGDKLPPLNGSGSHSLPYREGYESGTELALCRIIEHGEGDPRIPLADEQPPDAIEVVKPSRRRRARRGDRGDA